MKRNLGIALTFVAVLALLGIGSAWLEKKATVEAAGVQAPRFEVDPMWPKPLPNHWVRATPSACRSITTITSGSFIVPVRWSAWRPTQHATPVASECCTPAPAVLEFDEEGNLLTSWGGTDGPGYEWPASNHGITVDYKGNVWIGGNGRTANAPPAAESAGNAAPTQAEAGSKSKSRTWRSPTLSRQHGAEVHAGR